MREKLFVVKGNDSVETAYVLGNWVVFKNGKIWHRDHFSKFSVLEGVPKETVDTITTLFTDDRIEYFDTSIPDIYRIFIKYNIPIPNVKLLDPAIVVVIARHTLKYVDELFDYEFDPCVRLAHIKCLRPRQGIHLIENGEDDPRVLERMFKSKHLHTYVRKAVKESGSEEAKKIFRIK